MNKKAPTEYKTLLVQIAETRGQLKAQLLEALSR
jgi:hypothetical protein